MLTLPTARRAYLIGFWCVLSLTSGAIVAIAFFAFGFVAIGSCILVLTAVFLLAGFVWFRKIAPVYSGWNLVATRYTRFVEWAILWICFFIIFWVMGRVGHVGNIMRENRASLWFPRATLPPDTYFSQYDQPVNALSIQGWLSTLLTWTIRSGRVWAIGLIPFLLLLSLLSDDDAQRFPASIYTLF